MRRLDWVPAAVLAVAGVVEAATGWTGPVAGPLVLVSVPVAMAALAVRRLRPLVAAAGFVAVCVAQALLGSDLPGGLSEGLAVVLLVATVGATAELRTSLATLGLVLGGMTLVIGVGEDPRVGNVVYLAAVLGVAWAAGHAVRLTRERGRLDAEARLQAERTRLAGELHDVVAHHVTAMVVQASAERRDLPAGSHEAEVLAGLEQQGRETLTQLRALLGVLHADGSTSLTPQPGLDEVPELVRQAAASGVTVTLRVEGTPRPLGDAAGLTVYRVVQECLTNVRKHSGSAAATVVVRWLPAAVEVEVHDPGPGRRTPWFAPSGFGLQGLAERVRAVGGALVADRDGEGFRVRASIPATVSA